VTATIVSILYKHLFSILDHLHDLADNEAHRWYACTLARGPEPRIACRDTGRSQRPHSRLWVAGIILTSHPTLAVNREGLVAVNQVVQPTGRCAMTAGPKISDRRQCVTGRIFTPLVRGRRKPFGFCGCEGDEMWVYRGLGRWADRDRRMVEFQ
jgi:hypothetical protein